MDRGDAMNEPTGQPDAAPPKTGEGEDRRPRVVVGIDGSSHARSALVFAFIAAAQRGVDLDVVSSYWVELSYIGSAPLDIPDVTAIRRDTHDRVRAMVDTIRDEIQVSTVPEVRTVDVRIIVSEGSPAQVLVDRSEGAVLLVVGSRGRGATRSAL